MASKRIVPAKQLFSGFSKLHQPPASRPFTRTLTTESTPPASTHQPVIASNTSSLDPNAPSTAPISLPTSTPTPLRTTPRSTTHQQPPPTNPFLTTPTVTLHAFPSLRPTLLVPYPSTHLQLPLRKDLLHRAVIYEGDSTRQGTASTQWRSEVHGSGRKVRPQKGTGSARLGDKKSPMLRGGGVAFGPKPRSFKTGLQKKVYDMAWRTALSYRYKMGELLVVDGEAELDVHRFSAERYLRDLLKANGMGSQYGRTLFVTLERRERLFEALAGETMGKEGKAREVADVDVKNLLEMARVVVERGALEWMFAAHESDLPMAQRVDPRGEIIGAFEGLALRDDIFA